MLSTIKCRVQSTKSAELRVRSAELKDRIVGEGFPLPRVQDRHKVTFAQKTTHPSFAANIMFATNATFPDKGRLGSFALCGER